jgi:hypothetical protein
MSRGYGLQRVIESARRGLLNGAEGVASHLSASNTDRQTARNCLTVYYRVRVWQQEGAPPVAEFDTGYRYIPVQKIFAKVKPPLTCGYRYCE